MASAAAPSAWTPFLGATVTSAGVVFRVWAPLAQRVAVALHTPRRQHLPLRQVAEGVWEVQVPACPPGTRYTYWLDDRGPFPDPYSRSQPLGVHGPSEVVDPAAYHWHDQDWPGLEIRGLVLYECHVGTATPAGTCEALIDQLPRLRALGIGALELMPVAAFPGRWNWGYDGVYPFAVSANYGGPLALKRLVDAAHQCGLGVILDVVYNHLGPEGNYLGQFSPYYFSTRYRTPWGPALNFDGPHCAWVRQLVLDNACFWLREYHLDGLRLDAVSYMYDRTQPHILQELVQRARAAVPRPVVLIAETSDNDVRYVLPPAAGGYGFDAVWADDFAWALHRYLTGEGQGRYQDYAGTLAEVARTLRQGFLYEGQWSSYLGRPRGTPARQQPAWQFQYCLQHHDHVGNRPLGERLHHRLDLARYRVASALLLLLPYTPLLFMGQEFVASSPFLYFTDHPPALGRRVAAARRRELAAVATAEVLARLPDPQDEATFRRCKLPLHESEQSPGREMQRLYADLLRLRRADPVLAQQDRFLLDAWAATPDLLVVAWRHPRTPRLLLANFGAATQLHRSALRTSLPPGAGRVLLDTAARDYGGRGARSTVTATALSLPAHTALLLAWD